MTLDERLSPTTEAELCDAIAAADGPLRIQGGGTRPIGHTSGTGLVTARLSGITLYEPGALTLVALSGTPLAEIETALAAQNQRLAFEPMDHRALLGTCGTPTIGGAVAVNASGPRRIQAGACRDSLIGVRFVDGRGTAIKNGGRVMKNVTGYDLVKLMAGSYGTLGVLSEVSFKLLPGVAATATMRLEGQTPQQAVATMSRALGSPFEVSGAAHSDGVTWLRIEGFEASVAYRAGQLSKLFADAEQITDPGITDRIWTDIRDVRIFADQPGDVWRISVKPSDGPAVLQGLDDARCLLDWGGGLVWALVPPGTDLRATMDVPGHATLMRAEENRLPTFHAEPAPLAAISKGLRAKFDPRGILNPGLMG